MTLVDRGTENDRVELERTRARLQREIRDYPRPIPACDAQFNYLLEERSRVDRELAWMESREEDRK